MRRALPPSLTVGLLTRLAPSRVAAKFSRRSATKPKLLGNVIGFFGAKPFINYS
jgi:hypothetical protein